MNVILVVLFNVLFRESTATRYSLLASKLARRVHVSCKKRGGSDDVVCASSVPSAHRIVDISIIGSGFITTICKPQHHPNNILFLRSASIQMDLCAKN